MRGVMRQTEEDARRREDDILRAAEVHREEAELEGRSVHQVSGFLQVSGATRSESHAGKHGKRFDGEHGKRRGRDGRNGERGMRREEGLERREERMREESGGSGGEIRG
eukprot:1579071-Rhodomonas_salina.2